MYSEELIDKSKQCLANTFIMYMKAHSYHWNVTGSNFPQYHEFLGNLYEELHDAIDPLAEHIRTLDSFAPMSLARMIELSRIKEDTRILNVSEMFDSLIKANDILVDCMHETYALAEKETAYAYSNFIQDRLTAHAKHSWMLNSIIKK